MSSCKLMCLFCTYGARRYDSLNGPYAWMTSHAWHSRDVFPKYLTSSYKTKADGRKF